MKPAQQISLPGMAALGGDTSLADATAIPTRRTQPNPRRELESDTPGTHRSPRAPDFHRRTLVRRYGAELQCALYLNCVFELYKFIIIYHANVVKSRYTIVPAGVVRVTCPAHAQSHPTAPPGAVALRCREPNAPRSCEPNPRAAKETHRPDPAQRARPRGEAALGAVGACSAVTGVPATVRQCVPTGNDSDLSIVSQSKLIELGLHHIGHALGCL
jgi:hypothetical protein